MDKKLFVLLIRHSETRHQHMIHLTPEERTEGYKNILAMLF